MTLLALSPSEADSTASWRLLEPSVIAPLSCILFEFASTTSAGSSEMRAHFELCPVALGTGSVVPFELCFPLSPVSPLNSPLNSPLP